MPSSTFPALVPARFPRRSGASVKLFNLVATRRAQLKVELDGAPTTLRLGAPPPIVIGLRTIPLALGSDRMWLLVSKESVARLCSTWLTDEPFNLLPRPLREAMLTVTLSPLLASLSALTGVETLRLPDDEVVPANTLPRFGLWHRDDAFGALQLEHAAAANLATALQRLPPSPPTTARWPELPIELRLVIGRSALGSADLLALEPGDVLLLPPTADENNSPLTLCHGERRLATARIDRNRVTIEQPLAPEARMTDNDEDNAHDEPEPAGLSAQGLDVRLSFDLGQTTLPLAELQNIEPGYTFTLDLVEEAGVRLRAGSKVIGRGELVQVDDRLGVRVTTLFPSIAEGGQEGAGDGAGE